MGDKEDEGLGRPKAIGGQADGPGLAEEVLTRDTRAVGTYLEGCHGEGGKQPVAGRCGEVSLDARSGNTSHFGLPITGVSRRGCAGTGAD